MREIIRKLNLLLDKKQKHTMVWLVVMMIFGAVLETAGIALVLAAVSLIMSDDLFEKQPLIAAVYDFFGFKDYASFVVFVLILLIAAFVLKNIYLFLEWKAMYSFVYRNQFRTSQQMLKNYLKRNYEYYLFADTSVVQRNITSDVNNMYALILSILTIISEGVIFIALVAMLLYMEPVMCIVIGVLLLVTMLVVTKILKPIMYKSGKENQDYYSGLYKWISQIVQGIKEVKVASKEQHFIREYVACGKGYVNAVERYSLYNNTPKLLLETVCIAGMVLYMVILVLMGENLSDKIPIISGFATAAIKLMPAANKINNQLNAIAFCEPPFNQVADKLIEELSGGKEDAVFAEGDCEKLPVKSEITLSGITYKYPKTEKYIFENASMEIPIGSAVGVVGQSGAGKTTIVDILLGLLELEAGGVYADGVNTKDNYRGWLKNLGYIPQMIYMLDGTIRDNVAFGFSRDEIDEDRVWEVLKEAHLDDFIKNLPDGLDTEIGERGIRLSGGQRQRIGIARALYEDPEVLILDEATSALDNDTESAIMESINSFQGKKTLIIIAHRLQTIEKCDMIYRVKDGKILRER